MMRLTIAPAIVLILITLYPLASSAEQGSSFFYSPAELNWIDCQEREWRPGKLSAYSHFYVFPGRCNYAVYQPALVDADVEVCIAYLDSDFKDGIKQLDRIIRKDSKASKNFYNRAAFKYLLKDYVGARKDLNKCLKLCRHEYSDDEKSSIEELNRKVCQELLSCSAFTGKWTGTYRYSFVRFPLIDAEADVCIAYLNRNLDDGIRQLDRIVREDSKASKNFYNRAAFKYFHGDCAGAREDLNSCLNLWIKENPLLEPDEADFIRYAIEELDSSICDKRLYEK